ncbi:hypothetical protein ABTJ08_19965, partial [Acinetobacter baumannii]
MQFPEGRVRTIRNGVDTDRFFPGDAAAARAALGLQPEDFVVGTVGRLVPVKAQHLLIEASARLISAGFPLVTALVGLGP